MKHLLFIIVSMLIVGCSASNPYNDEKMYDLASQFKDLSQTVDGAIKFGEVTIETGQQALERVSVEQPDKVAPFAEYVIKVELQGDNAVLLLCDDNIALIEDAGCNAVLDKVYWQVLNPNSCVITLDSHQLCK
ncbi:hypothetical protein [Neptuniibacter pectenicola]|jgi:hypothetical protein|uniref:hypothetical protein n=1 Tax=Neptuniibacter pectenicola TaxID=1806669 RepID=UPI0008343828|nr:hypothetical protein [Neptuniibacter pectenicola]